MLTEVVDDFVNRFMSHDAVHENNMPENYPYIDKCT